MFPIIVSVQQCFIFPNINMIVRDPVSFFSCQSTNPDECLTDIEITEPIIIDSIHELSYTFAAGPDGVPSSLLLNCAAELAPALKLLFSQSLDHGFIPASLKGSNGYWIYQILTNLSKMIFLGYLENK